MEWSGGTEQRPELGACTPWAWLPLQACQCRQVGEQVCRLVQHRQEVQSSHQRWQRGVSCTLRRACLNKAGTAASTTKPVVHLTQQNKIKPRKTETMRRPHRRAQSCLCLHHGVALMAGQRQAEGLAGALGRPGTGPLPGTCWLAGERSRLLVRVGLLRAGWLPG